MLLLFPAALTQPNQFLTLPATVFYELRLNRGTLLLTNEIVTNESRRGRAGRTRLRIPSGESSYARATTLSALGIVYRNAVQRFP